MKNLKIYIKDESKNKFGTYKDRRSEFIVNRAKKSKVSKLCLITSGNAGYSLAQIARPEGIRVVCIVDKNLKNTVKRKLKSVCHKVIERDLQKKILKSSDIIELSRENKEKIWDVTNGYSAAYANIISEIKDKKPDYLICPVGSGEAFVGFNYGLKKHRLKTKLIGIGVKKSPSVADKLSALWTPYKPEINKALKKGHHLIRLSEQEVLKTFNSRNKKIKSEISSSVVWAAFSKFNFPKNSRIVVINSGKGIS